VKHATRNIVGIPVSTSRPGVSLADSWNLWPCVLLSILLLARMARKLPVLPHISGDSPGYLAQAVYRPPLYGWLLAAWQNVVGGLEYLPLAQLMLLGAALCVFGIELGRLLRNVLVGPAAILVTLLHPAVHDSPAQIMTEAVYLATVLLGLAMLFRYCRRPDLAPLITAAACFGLSTLTRNTGLIFLLLPPLLVLFDPRCHFWPALRRCVAAGLVMLSVLGAGMTWTWLRYGHFELGSWAGISLLGKALVLTQPEDAAVLPAPVGANLPVVEESRRLMAAQPDLAARLRAQVQVSGDVRFPVFWSAADALWPEWQAADDREKGRLAMAISRRLIATHPWEYLNLWVHDWLSLVIHPAYWPAWATTEAADPHAFAFCRETDSCWGLERYDLPLLGSLALFGVSVPGTLVAFVLIFWLAPQVLRRRAERVTVLVWGMALMVHGTLLANSAFEAGHIRYTVALHVLDVALLLWLTARSWSSRRRTAA